jgi:uncharacterized protein
LIRRISIALAFLGLVFFPKALALADGTADPSVETVTVETGQGRVVFKAEIADTPEKRSRGLMFRDSMPEDHGMLFDFGEPRPVSMWMKDTKISLDMIFADTSGRVVAVAESTVPFSTDTITVDAPVKAVFEVNAGTARRIGLKPGGRLINPIFK